MQRVLQDTAFLTPGFSPKLGPTAAAGTRPGPGIAPTRASKTLRGRYEVGEVIGHGGFGVVCKGYDPVLERTVAVKICCRQDPDARTRFLREAAIGRLLDDPRVTKVHDSGSDGPTLFSVQEYLSGEDLGDLIPRRQPRSLADRLDILAQVAGGLAHAHSRGVLHRDVKPANVRVLEGGGVKIMDFGSAARPDADATLTEVGTILGTVAYMPPEGLSGQAPRARSDIYAFGVLAYELLAFRRPFTAPTLHGLIRQIQTCPPPPLTEGLPECPPDLAAIVLRCLSKDPEDRPRSFAELELDLRRLREAPAAQHRKVA